MTNPINVLLKLTHFHRAKSFRTSAALILITLTLMVAVLTTVATAQTYSDVHNFQRRFGAHPSGFLAQGRDGNFYGTTTGGGKSSCAYGCGTIFKITPSGTLKVLHTFKHHQGFYPFSGLTLGTDGEFYGTTAAGGIVGCNQGCGTIFKITKGGTLTTLYSFTQFSNGPLAPPIEGANGNFYGTTGGWNSYAGYAYKITSSGTFTLLSSLPGPSGSPLIKGTDGNFYGTTSEVSGDGVDTVFRMTPTGTVTIVYKFDRSHGTSPQGVILSSDGNFYGTAGGGGSNGGGVEFRLTPKGAITVLHNFPDPNYPNDGSGPSSGLVQAIDGNFYGVTESGGAAGCGVIFQITAAGAYSILYNFDVIHGAEPYLSSPTQHTNGKIYGLTLYGGAYSRGAFYSLDVGLVSFVRLVSTSGRVGRTIEVLGQGFTGTTAVSFNGTPATFTVVSDTFLKATVPSGATTGFVTVTTPGGTLTSNQEFRVKP